MPTIIDEGSLRFTFPAHWRAIKYDDTKFYRLNIIPTGANLKAIDIIAVPHPELNKLLMIEVKDFRGHALQNKNRIVSGELVLEVIEKVMDTLSSLHLVSYCQNGELAEFVTQDLRPPTKIELVLFMEEDAIGQLQAKNTKEKLRMLNRNKRIEEMTLSLRQKLKKTVKIKSKVVNTDNIEVRDGFTVVTI